ncbi:hypothetical protein GH714_025253 [Hevea brasiliensis]|uniref:Uncharacterized protein n=1 Tax=Hevea brasiliensis TaxID=3981 RepID=A0A6A6NJ33_HEVBR|nr:hypothetical protein GH714_025253 [Hevea brasiliensis]
MPWSDQDDDSSSDESSSSHSDSDGDKKKGTDGKKANKGQNPRKRNLKSGRRKSGAVDFDALRQHGYKGGLSVLSMPPPKMTHHKTGLGLLAKNIERSRRLKNLMKNDKKPELQ